MATTAIFAEILIIGLQAQVWIGLALLAASGPLGLDRDDLSGLDVPDALVVLVVAALAYVLGIIVDRLADTTLKWLEAASRGGHVKARLSKHPCLHTPAPVSNMRLVVMHESEGMTRFLDYQRSRWRIARATVFNLVLLIPAAVAALVVHGGEEPLRKAGWIALVMVVDALLAGAVYFAAVRIQDAYVQRLSDAYRYLACVDESGCLEVRREVVAAIAYRAADSGDKPQFRLVTTKGDETKWTFPKGHVEEGEKPWEAAAREAKEEAGVVGRVEHKALARYRYPTRTGERCVRAFLLDAEATVDAEEAFRRAGWFSFDEARENLKAGGREPWYGREHERVLKKAASEIAQRPAQGA